MGRLVGLNDKLCYQESLTSTMLRAEIQLDKSSIGAPVFNVLGEVVAIYTGYQPVSQEDHAEHDEEVHLLPSFLARNIYDSLKFKKCMKSPWTGFSVKPLSDFEKEIFPIKQGDQGRIAIEYVWTNSPAEQLDIQPGDMLVRFGRYRIESPADFQRWLYMYGVGNKVKMVFVRNGHDYIIKDYLIEERPERAKLK